MDYRKLNSHIILLGMVIVVGLFAAIVVRMAMLERGADAGTANLIFVLILGASAVLYLIIVSTLSNSVIPWIMRRLPTPKNRTAQEQADAFSEEDDDDEPEPDYSFAYPYIGDNEQGEFNEAGDDDSGKEEVPPEFAPRPVPTPAPAPKRPDWVEVREREFREKFEPFREYLRFAMEPHVSAEELTRLEEYVELFARETPLPKDIVSIRPTRLKNPDLYHFGWNMQNYFGVGKREEVVPWLQRVFTPLRDLEFSTIKGKLHDPQTRRHTIPNIDNIPKFMAEKRS